MHYLICWFYFLAVQDLCCCMKAFTSWGSQGLISSCGMLASYCGGFSFFFLSFFLSLFFYCSGFCHTLKWISHGFTCVPHPDPPSHLPLPLGLPSAPGLSAVSCIQPGLVICFTLDNIHVSMLFSWNIPPSPSPTESKRLFYTSVSLFLFCM